VIDRKKGYFPVPALKYIEGPYLDLVRDALTSQAARERHLFQDSYLDALFADPTGHITPLARIGTVAGRPAGTLAAEPWLVVKFIARHLQLAHGFGSTVFHLTSSGLTRGPRAALARSPTMDARVKPEQADERVA
jgi:hypothetical protein